MLGDAGRIPGRSTRILCSCRVYTSGILDRPLPLRNATGNAADMVTTSSAEARAYYLQGLNYLHGYAWIEGARSFNQALRLDPGFAMAHWGSSRIYSGLDDQARR